MAERTTVLCIGGPKDGVRVDYRGAVMDCTVHVVRAVATGLNWPSQALTLETLPRQMYRHATLTMQREDGRVEAFDFYLIDGLHRDDVMRALVLGYRKLPA